MGCWKIIVGNPGLLFLPALFFATAASAGPDQIKFLEKCKPLWNAEKIRMVDPLFKKADEKMNFLNSSGGLQSVENYCRRIGGNSQSSQNARLNALNLRLQSHVDEFYNAWNPLSKEVPGVVSNLERIEFSACKDQVQQKFEDLKSKELKFKEDFGRTNQACIDGRDGS